jgi:4-azaleucine resistance transporter AzlC
VKGLKQILKKALIDTIPVMTGYLCLGFGYGILHHSAGYGVLTALIISVTMFAGSMQYIGVGLLASGASLTTVALTTLLVQARHIFYGISMLEKYKGTGLRKFYLIFALTDETYSLMCNDHSDIPLDRRKDYYLAVSMLNHSYWIIGCVLGATTGTLVNFNSEGIDFVLTALFVTIFLEQWHNAKKHTPAILGVLASVICLLIFGSENFLIPTMAVIAVSLCLYKEEKAND